VCPTHAIKTITEEEKKVTQVGIAKFFMEKCIVHTEGTDCGACSEHCSTQAVHMIPYKGTITIPKIEPELCIGCGGCESICPVRPERAIVVIANDIHQTAELPPVEEVRKIDSIDFGF
jgi:formate hydrogenlyase subunit 6/NADH:ubiquinone oxidoreductase subunit I